MSPGLTRHAPTSGSFACDIPKCSTSPLYQLLRQPSVTFPSNTETPAIPVPFTCFICPLDPITIWHYMVFAHAVCRVSVFPLDNFSCLRARILSVPLNTVVLGHRTESGTPWVFSKGLLKEYRKLLLWHHSKSIIQISIIRF